MAQTSDQRRQRRIIVYWWGLRAAWMMARPLQLLSVILVYGLGLLVARAHGYHATPTQIILALVVLLAVAVSIHYANEYADHETDALTQPTTFSGGSGALPAGLIARGVVLWLALFVLAVGLAGGMLGLLTGWLPLWAAVVLVTGAFFGWTYSLPPLALAWSGWGELDNAVLGGLLLPVYGYLIAAGMISSGAVLVFIPFTMLVFLNLLATTWPDRHADAAVGKRTLATRWSADLLRRLYLGVTAGFTLMFGVLAVCILPAGVTLGSLIVLPLLLLGTVHYTRVELPHSTVGAMVLLLLTQMAGWFIVV
ncbi:MAG: prenyltransferase [Chloroflexota bacterium]